MKRTINSLLTKTFPARLRQIAHVITSVQGALAKEWWRDRVLDWHVVRHACAEYYGDFPVNEPWARSEAVFGTKYAYLLKDVEVALGMGRVRVGPWWIAESFGNFIHAPFGSIFLSIASRIAKFRRRCINLCGHNDECFVYVSSGPYFHFIMEELVPLLYALEYMPSASVVVLKSDYENVLYFKEYIDFLKKTGMIKSLLQVEGDFMKTSKYVFVTHENDSGLFCRESVDLIYRAYVGCTVDVQPSRKVFLTRKRRRFENQNELEAEAIKYGFEIIDTEGMSLTEQIRTFSEARCVVSNHGAGLTNLVFAHAGISVVELFPAGLLNDAYYRMAQIKDMRYQCLLSDNAGGVNACGSIDLNDFIGIINKL